MRMPLIGLDQPVQAGAVHAAERCWKSAGVRSSIGPAPMLQSSAGRVPKKIRPTAALKLFYRDR